MKTLDLSNIVENVRKLGATKVTLQHLVDSIKETTTAIVKGIGVDPSGVVALYGCVNSGSGLNFNISTGACYYNGEIYDVAAFVGTAGGGQTAVISIQVDYLGSDPVLYSDGNKYPTHAVRKMVWSFATSGSGLADYAGLVRLKDRVNVNLLDVPTQISTGVSGAVSTANAYTDGQVTALKGGVPAAGDTLNKLYNLITATGRSRGGWDASGGTVPPNSPTNKAGDFWRITVGGTIVGLLGGSTILKPGDLLFADVDGASSAGQFYAIQTNVDQATSSVLGLVKLYTDLAASNTDGSVTQQALVNLVSLKARSAWLSTGMTLGSGVSNVSFEYKKEDGVLKIRGLISIPDINLTSGTTILTLPVGFRPSRLYSFISITTSPNGLVTEFRRCFVNTNGDIRVYEPIVEQIIFQGFYSFDIAPWME